MKRFWNWIDNGEEGRILRLDGPIDEDDFWGDSVTPAAFRKELESGEGNVTVWINSPGGSVFAAAEIYNMLRDYKGKITVKIDAIAASAASVISMAGDTVKISPVGMIFIHDPMTLAMGNVKDMEKAISTLNEVKESIINAYQHKTGLSRNRIAKLMSDETWLNAKKAVELGFADEILFEGNKEKPEEEEEAGGGDPTQEEGRNEDGEEEKKKPSRLEGAGAVWQFSTKVMGEAILDRLGCFKNEAPGGTPDSTQAEEPSENGVTDDAVLKQEEAIGGHPEDTQELEDPGTPVIGMDGKTKDGAVPYEILKEKLEWLK